MRYLRTLLLAILLLPGVVTAKCPGTNVGVNSYAAFVTGYHGSGMTFIGGGCTTAKIGINAPDACWVRTGGGSHGFFARWSIAGDRTNAGTTAGCSFMCQGVGTFGTENPSCFIRASDGLPVELMEFSVGN